MQKSLSSKAKMCILFVVLVFLPFLVFVIKVLSKRLSENLFFSFTGYGVTELLLSAGGSYLRHTEKKLFCHSIQTGWWYSGHQLACLSLKLMLLLFICNVCLQKPMAWICYYMTLVQKQSFSWMSLSPGVLSTSSLFVFGWNYASWLKL